MRAMPVLFLALLISLASASEIDSLAADLAKPNESFSVVSALLDGKGYYLIGVGDSLVIAAEDTPGEYRVLTQEQEIFTVLADYQEYVGASYAGVYPSKSEFGRVEFLVRAFNASREPKEGNCERVIGIDLMPCFDLESCFKACYTPLCKPVALGIGWNFVSNISKLKNSLDALDGNMSGFFAAYSPVAGADDAAGLQEVDVDSLQPLYEKLGSALERVQGIGVSAGETAANPLFDNYVYAFCEPIPFDWSSLLEAKRLLQNYSARVGSVLALSESSRKIAEAGVERGEIAFSKRQSRICQSFGSSWRAGLNELRAQATEAEKEASFPGMNETIEWLGAKSVEAGEDCIDKKFDRAADAIDEFKARLNESKQEVSGTLAKLAVLRNVSAALAGNLSGLENYSRGVSDASFWKEFGEMNSTVNSENALLYSKPDAVALKNISASLASVDAWLGPAWENAGRLREGFSQAELARKALMAVVVLLVFLFLAWIKFKKSEHAA